jgi:imidazole glycerol-phosphate synthase subunit HisH
MSVVIVDYGSGNPASVLNMVRKVGGTATVSSDPAVIAGATKLILPGVGAFDHGVNRMHELGLFDPFKTKASTGIPVLGICVGAQLLGTGSEEGKLEGLGLVDVEMKKFVAPAGSDLRVPHVGWNTVNIARPNALIPPSADEQRFYFTHSYHPVCANEADVLAMADYGYRFAAAFGRGNVYGVQFHPEKSHRFGMALIRNFLGL